MTKFAILLNYYPLPSFWLGLAWLALHLYHFERTVQGVHLEQVWSDFNRT